MRWMKAVRRRYGVALSAAAVAGVLVTGCGGAASRLASHVDRGKAYMTQGDFTHASIEFRNAMQIAPKDGSVRLLAGHAAERLGQIREAAALYQSVIDSDADNVEARASLGRLFAFGGASQRALDVVAPGLAKHPNDVRLLVIRGAARLQLKDPQAAIQDVDHALQLAPTNEDAVALRANLYRQAGDLAHAEALLTGALQALPKSVDLREVLANLYLSNDDPAKAEDQLRRLIEMKPHELRMRRTLAGLYVRTHRPEDARKVLEAAVQAFPKDDEAKLTLVSFVTAQGSRSQGEQLLRKFITQQPDDYELRFALADLQQKGGATQDALATYNEIIRRDGMGPKGLLARDRVAALDAIQGHDQDALQLVAQVLGKSPRDSDALLVRAELGTKRGDFTSAIADLRAVLRDQPRSVPVERMLARAYQANGQPGLAEEALRTATDISPADIAVRIELAQLLARTQRSDQAVSLLEEGVTRNPKDTDLRVALIEAYLAKHDFASAYNAAQDLATLAPNAAEPRYLAGVAAQGQKKLDLAQTEFEKALQLRPGASEPLAALARLDLARGQGAQAIDLVQKALAASDPKDATPVNLLGEVYLANKNIPQAVATLSRAVSLAPSWWPARRNLALAKAAANDPEGAIAAYDGAIKVAPTEPQLVVELAQFEEGRGRIDAAIVRYEELHRRNPQLQLAANNLAMLLATYKKDRQSLDRARDLTAGFESSNSSELLDTYGWVHFKRGEYAQALPVLERAAERAPDGKEIRYHLGMAELQAGQRDRARTNLEAAAAGAVKYPWSEDARAVLAGLKDQTG